MADSIKNSKAEKNIIVTGSGAQVRLDKYLSGKLNLTRSKIKKLIESGFIKVNGKVKNSHYNVFSGDIVTYVLPEEKIAGVPQDVALKVIFECKNYVVIDKPPYLVVHPAPGVKEGTLLNGLLQKYEAPQLVHRLDKDTSGVIIAALNEKAALDIRKQFKEKSVKKVYLAIVDGVIDTDAGQISVPIRRSRRDPTKMSVGWSKARESITRFKVKKRYDNAALIEAYPLSGRTHQIRVHLAYYGYPVLGDVKYGNGVARAPRQMLHASQITFRDPEKGERVHFSSPVPDDFKKILEKLK